MQSIHPTQLEPFNGCISSAISVIGKKWTALILRDLIDAPKRFCELERSVGHINPRTLSQRLDELLTKDIVQYNSKDLTYSLTKKGQDLLPILVQMAAWGTKYPL